MSATNPHLFSWRWNQHVDSEVAISNPNNKILCFAITLTCALKDLYSHIVQVGVS
jgi:hypothetical protein